MVKKFLTMMLVSALSVTCLFACSKDEAADNNKNTTEKSKDRSEADIHWTEVGFVDLFAHKESEEAVYELHAQMQEADETFKISEEQYNALWYYCYGLTTDSDNDFHLYIAYDESKNEETTEKGTVTDYKIVNNDETVSVNGTVKDAKEYFIDTCDLFEVGEGNFILSMYNEVYEDLESDEGYIMYTGYWYEDDGSVEPDALAGHKSEIAPIIIYKKDNEELFNQLVEYADKKIDYIKCTAKCDVKVVRVFGMPSNEFQIVEIDEIITKD